MGFFDFLKKKEKAVGITDEERLQLANNMAANANMLVKQFNDDALLDFSINSLQHVDQIIADSSEFYRKADNETKRKMIIKIGSYIFEVAKCNWGGQYYWYERLNQPILVTGKPQFEMSLLTYEKVRKNFENGTADNISLFLEKFKQGVEEKATLMIT